MSAPNLQGYVEVHQRIAAFREKHPEGSLQGSYEVRELNGDTLIVYRAAAYRTPDDPRPGIGYASEPVPGRTPYTKDSELMNAETSAWGRALAALGFEVHTGIASANEVRARSDGGNGATSSAPAATGFAVKPDGKSPQRDLTERLLKGAGLSAIVASEVIAHMNEHFARPKISEAIDNLKDEAKAKDTAADLAAKAKAQLALTTPAVPVDDSDLPPAE